MSKKAERRAARLAARIDKKMKPAVKEAVEGVDVLPESEVEPRQRRSKREPQTIVCETFVKVDGDTAQVYTDYHDGTSPKVHIVKKGDYLRLRITLEV